MERRAVLVGKLIMDAPATLVTIALPAPSISSNSWKRFAMCFAVFVSAVVNC